MKDYKKIIVTMLSLTMLTGMLSGCGNSTIEDNDSMSMDTTNIEDTQSEESISNESSDVTSESLITEVTITDTTSESSTEISTIDSTSTLESSFNTSQQYVTTTNTNTNTNGISNNGVNNNISTEQVSAVEGFDIPVDADNVNVSEVLVQSISLSKNIVSIAVGESDMPIVKMSPSNASDMSEIWESSNSQVATVDNLGNIIGISEGTCTVTVKAKANTSVYAEISVTVTAKEETQKEISSNGVTEPTYIEGVLIANKTYALPSDYNPYNGSIAPEVQEAFNKMQQDALAEGLNLYISSGFRSYEYQAGLYERYAQRDGYDMADTYSARAGHSEHQTGLCFDLNTIDDSFANTPEGIWVAENCYKYGFIIRYPKGKESITGYQYEPWHLRYLGEFLATDVYNSGLCLEEYLGITSQYAE